MGLTAAEEAEIDRLIDREMSARASDERARRVRAQGREPSAASHAVHQRSDYIWRLLRR